jgi:hypothetical protein
MKRHGAVRYMEYGGITIQNVERRGSYAMAERTSSAHATTPTRHRIHRAGVEALEAAQAEQVGTEFQWHFGRVTRLGTFEVVGREVTIGWEEGGTTTQQGDITDEQWEIFKLAFLSTGRIAVLSDKIDETWMYDYRFLEAIR